MSLLNNVMFLLLSFELTPVQEHLSDYMAPLQRSSWERLTDRSQQILHQLPRAMIDQTVQL